MVIAVNFLLLILFLWLQPELSTKTQTSVEQRNSVTHVTDINYIPSNIEYFLVMYKPISQLTAAISC